MKISRVSLETLNSGPCLSEQSLPSCDYLKCTKCNTLTITLDKLHSSNLFKSSPHLHPCPLSLHIEKNQHYTAPNNTRQEGSFRYGTTWEAQQRNKLPAKLSSSCSSLLPACLRKYVLLERKIVQE